MLRPGKRESSAENPSVLIGLHLSLNVRLLSAAQERIVPAGEIQQGVFQGLFLLEAAFQRGAG